MTKLRTDIHLKKPQTLLPRITSLLSIQNNFNLNSTLVLKSSNSQLRLPRKTRFLTERIKTTFMKSLKFRTKNNWKTQNILITNFWQITLNCLMRAEGLWSWWAQRLPISKESTLLLEFRGTLTLLSLELGIFSLRLEEGQESTKPQTLREEKSYLWV